MEKQRERREFVKLTGEWEALTQMSLQMGARLEEIERRLAEQTAGSVCRVCGCTDDRACPGGCSWVAANLCSRCAPGVLEDPTARRVFDVTDHSGGRIILP